MDYTASQQLVVDERNALEAKMTTLVEYIANSEEFALLPVEDRGRLRIQLSIMRQYSDILFVRIDHFAKP
jgi:hypothetical protein